MRVDTGDSGSGGGSSQEKSLWAKANNIYPQSISGTFRNIKWALMVVTLGVYYFLPFVRWDRGPNAPDQAVLIDFPSRRFYFFFIEIWPQEVYYLTGLLIIAAMTLFLMNAVAGRIWCGYLCWQTVWTDLFYAVENWVEGSRRDRLMKDKQGWTFRRVREKAVKHFIWLLIAWWTGGAWVLYFSDAPTLVKDLATFQAPFVAYLWIGILTFTTYIFAGFGREQVCIYMCPWPRIQASLTDEWALNIEYRTDRGEPRGSLKKMKELGAKGEPSGDCIDCGQCIAVCPTGTDIRNGVQLSCIQCGLCIDACDAVMNKIGKPTGLIAYDTDININRRRQGLHEIYKLVRPRTLIYVVIILAVAGFMTFTFTTRSMSGMNVLHDRNPLYVQLSEGGVRNGFTVRMLNKHTEPGEFVLSVEGIDGLRIEAIGVEGTEDGNPVVAVDRDTTREVRVLVFSPKGVELGQSTPITFRLVSKVDGETTTVNDYFKAP